MQKLHIGKVINIEKVAKGTYSLQFSSDIKEIKAGQFLSILCPPKVLRRPFGVADFENGVFNVLFKIRGGGTKYLLNLRAGDEISFNAPLGQPFLKTDAKKALLIGAGIGIAPLFYLNKELKMRGVETKIVNGVNTDDEVISGCDYTKIGGSILDEISQIIDEYKPEMLYCCAPPIVLKLMAKIAKEKNLPLQVALERVMACGIGVCRSCVIKIKTQNGIENRTICADGPVFWAHEVVFDD